MPFSIHGYWLAGDLTAPARDSLCCISDLKKYPGYCFNTHETYTVFVDECVGYFRDILPDAWRNDPVLGPRFADLWRSPRKAQMSGLNCWQVLQFIAGYNGSAKRQFVQEHQLSPDQAKDLTCMQYHGEPESLTQEEWNNYLGQH